jgi:hypothetical protein
MPDPFFRQVPEITEQYSVAAFPTTFIFKVNEKNVVHLNQLPTLFKISGWLSCKKSFVKMRPPGE